MTVLVRFLLAGLALLRDELLNEELFDSLADARRKLTVWRYDYNNVRPHSSLGNRTPAQVRRAFLQDGSVLPGALVPAGMHEYQTGKLSLRLRDQQGAGHPERVLLAHANRLRAGPESGFSHKDELSLIDVGHHPSLSQSAPGRFRPR